MKSLHDYRGEYRAARRRYGRAYNSWRRSIPWTTQCTARFNQLTPLTFKLRSARDAYEKVLDAKLQELQKACDK